MSAHGCIKVCVRVCVKEREDLAVNERWDVIEEDLPIFLREAGIPHPCVSE